MEKENQTPLGDAEQKRKEALNDLGMLIGVILITPLIIGFCFVMWEVNNFNDRFLFNVAYRNGFSPSLLLMILCLGFIGIGVRLFYLSKSNKKNGKPDYSPIAFIFVVFGIVNIGWWVYREFEIKSYNLNGYQTIEYFRIKDQKEGYVFIGETVGYNKRKESDKCRFYLYVKVIEGRRYYYCSEINDNGWRGEKLLLKRYNDHDGIVGKYVIEFDFDWDNLNVTNEETGTRKVSQKSIEKAIDEANSRRSVEEIKKEDIEHERQLQPMQEWVDCGACLGSRNCRTCGGSGWVYNPSSSTGREECYSCNGRKDCIACGGRGGQYVTVYR